ncbi:MAG: M15 family metallopeptidase [Ardenticatenaceae bacterium]|nr:M15 family metallopeptidase [Ardenticatenaceae bacterium]
MPSIRPSLLPTAKLRYNSAAMRQTGIVLIWILVGLVLAGCRPAEAAAGTAVSPTAARVLPTTGPATAVPTLRPSATAATAVNAIAQAAPATPTLIPTSTSTATPAATATPTTTPTATPIPACTQRMAQDDLLTLVTLTYGLSRDYAPQDLVPLSDYFPVDVTLGYPTEIREVAIGPLVDMVTAMQEAGLQPQIISGYRSYYAQSVAFSKWLEQNPDSATIVSAPPGHSEHQLGTAVDFGSPELADVVGEPDIEFHTYFFKTSEGAWLLENAHRYGFTLSYTRETFELTGLYYEPWHYRYVGVEMATHLKELGQTLTQYQLANQPEPCIPEQP